jgi:hypothetical protein
MDITMCVMDVTNAAPWLWRSTIQMGRVSWPRYSLCPKARDSPKKQFQNQFFLGTTFSDKPCHPFSMLPFLILSWIFQSQHLEANVEFSQLHALHMGYAFADYIIYIYIIHVYIIYICTHTPLSLSLPLSSILSLLYDVFKNIK